MLVTLKNIYNNICNGENKPVGSIGFAKLISGRVSFIINFSFGLDTF